MSKKIKNNIIYIALFLVFLFINLQVRDFADDVTFKEGFRQFGGVFGWIAFYYMNWSGRIIPHGILIVLLNVNPIIFAIINALMMAALCKVVTKLCAIGLNISEDVQAVLGLAFGICMMFAIPQIIFSRAALWKTAAVLYTWGTTLGLISILPITYRHNDVDCPRLYNVLAIPCAMFAGNVEQVAAFIVAYMAIMMLCNFCKHKKIEKYDIVMLVIALASMLVSVLAPGNSVRSDSETVTWFSSYGMFTFTEKLIWGFTYAMTKINTHGIGFMVVITSLLLIIVYKRNKLVEKLMVLIPFFYYLIAGLMRIPEEFWDTSNIKVPEVFNKYLYDYITVDGVDFAIHKNNIISSGIGMIAFFLVVMLLFLAINDSVEWMAMLLFGGAFGTAYMMVFTPTVYASGVRVLYPMCVLLMTTVVRLVSLIIANNLSREDKNG